VNGLDVELVSKIQQVGFALFSEPERHNDKIYDRVASSEAEVVVDVVEDDVFVYL
jgi:hypothetical protein